MIDNRPGASEMIATEFLARSAPDGYTIAIFSNALSINETLSPARRYDAKRDLLPVTKLAELPFALIVAAPLPVNTLKEFVEYAKSNTTKLSYGHVGVGAPHYLTMEWFKREAGIDLLAVPYRSSPPVYTGLLGGEIQVTVGALGGATQLIEAGKVKALAAMSKQRPVSQPNLPTVSEFGYKEFDLVPWMGVFLPATCRPMSCASSRPTFSTPRKAPRCATSFSRSGSSRRRPMRRRSASSCSAISATGRR